MSDSTNVIDLFPGKSAEPPLTFENGDQALSAVRYSLDKLAEACSAAGLFWPTSDEQWLQVAKAGLRSRLAKIRGAE